MDEAPILDCLSPSILATLRCSPDQGDSQTMGQRYGLNSCRKSQSVRDWHVLCERIIRERALQILVLHLHEHILKVRIEAIYDASDIDPNDDDSDDDLGLGATSSL